MAHGNFSIYARTFFSFQVVEQNFQIFSLRWTVTRFKMLFSQKVSFCLLILAIAGAITVEAKLRAGETSDPRLYKAQHSFRSPFYIGTNSFLVHFVAILRKISLNISMRVQIAA